MTKRLPLLAFVLAAACPLSGSGQRAAEAPTTPTGPAALSDFFKPGVVFQDRNNDGVVDFVDARLVMPEHPTTGELAAAADVAARLGFETSAMNLPVARADVARGFQPSGTVASIFIGVKSLAPSGVSVQSLGGGTLKAGDGFVAAFTIGRQPAVAVLGGDDDGLNAAAVSLAGHLPYVWDQKSATVDKIAADVKQWLAGKGVTPTAVTTPAIYVKSNPPAATEPASPRIMPPLCPLPPRPQKTFKKNAKKLLTSSP